MFLLSTGVIFDLDGVDIYACIELKYLGGYFVNFSSYSGKASPEAIETELAYMKSELDLLLADVVDVFDATNVVFDYINGVER